MTPTIVVAAKQHNDAARYCLCLIDDGQKELAVRLAIFLLLIRLDQFYQIRLLIYCQ